MRLVTKLRGWAGAFADVLAAAWQWCRDLWALLRLSRFSLLGVLIFGFFVIGNSQGRETALLFTDIPWKYSLLTLLFAVFVWLWARLMVTYRFLPMDRRSIDVNALESTISDFSASADPYDQPPPALTEKLAQLKELDQQLHSVKAIEKLKFWMLWTPRILGTLVIVAAAGSLGLAAYNYRAPQLWYASAGALVVAIGFLFFVANRRPLVQALTMAFFRPDWLKNVSEKRTQHRWAETLRKRFNLSLDLDKLRKPGWFRTTLGAVFAINSRDDIQKRWRWYAWKDLNKATRGWLYLIAALQVTMFAWATLDPQHFGRYLGPLGALVFTVSFWMMAGTVIVYLLDHRRVPVLTLFVLWAVVIGFSLEHHEVRLLNNAPAKRLEQDTDVASATKEFVAASGQARPILVATAGGGIRAAYWTAVVLATLHHEAGQPFQSNLFAVSAVSGGGLGAAAYLAAIKHGKKCDKPIGEQVRAFLSEDFLSPTLSALLSWDVIYGILPLPGIPDRAQALEQAWERGWARTCPGASGAFTDRFLSLRSRTGDILPALLINGTLVQSGKRIITSPITVSSDVFHEAQDFYNYVGGHEIRLSTAVHNGARFTFVSPAGMLERKTAQGNIDATGQVIDGGYFENYGAETAFDLLFALCKHMDCKDRNKPIIIQISSEPGLKDTTAPTNPPPSPPALGMLETHSQAYAPVAGFAQTRGARGVNAMQRLRALAEDYGGTFVHLRLCQLSGHEEPPLGWVLSEQARNAIEAHLNTGCKRPVDHNNAAEFKKIYTALGLSVKPERDKAEAERADESFN